MGNFAAANENSPRLVVQQGRASVARDIDDNEKQRSTHICVLSVDASGRYDPRTLFVLIDGKRICVDVALDDLETGLVCNAIAVSEGRVASILVSRHDMGRA